MIQVMCVYALQSGKKDKFYDELVHKWNMKGTKELTWGNWRLWSSWKKGR